LIHFYKRRALEQAFIGKVVKEPSNEVVFDLVMNILLEEVFPVGVGGGSLSALGSSFESEDQPFIFTIGINPTPDFAGKDVILDPAVQEADRKLNQQNRASSPPVFGSAPDPPTNSRDAVVDRLSSLYQDPEFGPEYFRQNARLIKHLLLVYKTCKANPNLGMFFHKGSKTGIHIHFNSVSKKKQLVIPLGSPNLEPIRIDIGEVKSWYKAQRRKAITARLKAQLEIMELKLALSKAKNAMNAASVCLDNLFGRIEDYLDSCLKMTGSEEVSNESLPAWATECGDPRIKQIRARKSEISSKTDMLAKLLDEQGMHEEKDFLQLMLVGVKDVTEEFLSLSKLVNEVYDSLVKCNKETREKEIKMAGHNLRSRDVEGNHVYVSRKIRQNVEFITRS